MRKQIFLHAGAHRTGSSSFQMCLHTNRPVLHQSGYDVVYPTRDGVPKGRLKLRLPAPRHRGKDMGKFLGSVRESLARFSPDPERRLIMSEENITGRMFHFYQGAFLPAADLRFQVFREGIGNADLHLLFVLRDYDVLYASAYRKRAEDNQVPDFQTLVPRFLDIDRGWPEVIQMMQTLLMPKHLTVLPYDRRGQSRRLLARLLPDVAPETLREPEGRLNLSATDAALQALQAQYRAGTTLSRPQWQEIVRTHADDPRSLDFATFPDEARERLQARYAQDLERIQRMDGVTWL